MIEPQRQLIERAVERAAQKSKQFFLQKGWPKCHVTDSGVNIEFEVKSKFQRSYDLPAFENVMKRFKADLEASFGVQGIPLKFWACSATEMEWEFEEGIYKTEKGHKYIPKSAKVAELVEIWGEPFAKAFATFIKELMKHEAGDADT